MKNSNHSNYILRKRFSEKDDGALIPDLISLQKDSYKKFLEKDNKENQANSGLTRAFKSFFPLSDLNMYPHNLLHISSVHHIHSLSV